MPSNRKDRIGAEMLRILSDIINTQLRDPALPLITSVVHVDVAADLSTAKVRVSVLNDEEALRRAVEALNRASGFIRHELGARMDLRHVPKLTFIGDRSISHSIHVQKILDQIRDEQQQQEQE